MLLRVLLLSLLCAVLAQTGLNYATCTSAGDPHYKAFGNQRWDYQQFGRGQNLYALNDIRVATTIEQFSLTRSPVGLNTEVTVLTGGRTITWGSTAEPAAFNEAGLALTKSGANWKLNFKNFRSPFFIEVSKGVLSTKQVFFNVVISGYFTTAELAAGTGLCFYSGTKPPTRNVADIPWTDAGRKADAEAACARFKANAGTYYSCLFDISVAPPGSGAREVVNAGYGTIIDVREEARAKATELVPCLQECQKLRRDCDTANNCAKKINPAGDYTQKCVDRQNSCETRCRNDVKQFEECINTCNSRKSACQVIADCATAVDPTASQRCTTWKNECVTSCQRTSLPTANPIK